MRFTFTDDQITLRSEARAFLDARLPLSRMAQIADSEAGWDPALWREIADLQWPGVSIPESLGGVGLGAIEEAILFEELGRVCFPGPYFSTVGLAREALAAAPELIEGIARGSSWTLVEDASAVPDLQIAEHVVVWHDDALWRADGGHRAARDTVDGTRRLGRFEIASCRLEPLCSGAEAATAMARVRRRMLVALSCEAVGVAQRALDLAVQHARAREQYGRPIGSFQAVAHSLATAYAELELSRSLAYWAAWCLDVDHPSADVAAVAAKARAAETAVDVCERSIQVHAGSGFTWELPLHRLYKRALWIDTFGGAGGEHRARIAAALLDAA